jgi:hypothetical protein
MKIFNNLRLTILYFILISFIVSQIGIDSTNTSTNGTEVTNTSNSTNTTNTTNITDTTNTTDTTNGTNISNTTNNTNNITFPDLNISNSTVRIVPNYLCSPTGKLAIVKILIKI